MLRIRESYRHGDVLDRLCACHTAREASGVARLYKCEHTVLFLPTFSHHASSIIATREGTS